MTLSVPAELLKTVMPHAGKRADEFADALNAAMHEWQIRSRIRAAAFLGQVAHESGSLLYVQEIASGEAYEGREDLGNTQAGDGVRFKGRGLIQITGRANYARCAGALGLDCVRYPKLLEQPIGACRSAGWFWMDRGLNEFADKNAFGTITKRINGGYNGLDDRINHWLTARRVLGV